MNPYINSDSRAIESAEIDYGIADIKDPATSVEDKWLRLEQLNNQYELNDDLYDDLAWFIETGVAA